MLPISRATLSVAAGTGEGHAQDAPAVPATPPDAPGVTTHTSPCLSPQGGAPMIEPGQAKQALGVTMGTVTAPQGPQPLVDGLLPYSWSGLPGSGGPGKREAWWHGPECGALSRAAGTEPRHLHLPLSPSCQEPPEAKSRGPGAAQKGWGGSGEREQGHRGAMGLEGTPFCSAQTARC